MLGTLAAVLILHVGDQSLRVDTTAPPRAVVIETGETRYAWTPEDARRIVDALTKAGAEAAIAPTLGGLRPEEPGESCLTLDLPGGTLHLKIPGAIHRGAAGEIVWTAPQLETIGRALKDRGIESQLPGIFGLRLEPEAAPDSMVQPGFGDGPTPFRGSVVNPGCGQCATGGLCSVKGQWQCCTGGASCTACKVCS